MNSRDRLRQLNSERVVLVKQIGRFGTVGALATVVHLCVYLTLADLFALWALAANAIAFLIALCISFVGQAGWAFRNPVENHWISSDRFWRFLVSSLSGLVANTLIITVVVVWLGYPPIVALPLMATLVPAGLFLLNRYWVFPA